MDSKPQFRTINEMGSLGDVRWEAEIRKWDGGKFEVVAIRTRVPLGTSLATFRPRQHAYDDLAGARREVERLVVDIVFDPFDKGTPRASRA
jgi:hypothetical protein